MPSTNHIGRGRLISLEGLNGVGKTYLTTRVVAAAADHGQPPLVVEGFSRRCDNDDDLGRRLLRTLVTASHGERFLRAGFPKSETLLLLAIKMHDFETAAGPDHRHHRRRRGSGRPGRSPRRRRLHRRAVAPAPPRRRTVRALVLGFRGVEDHWSACAEPWWCHVDTSEHWASKEGALRCYATQLRDNGHPRCVDHIRTVDAAAGGALGWRYAESFVPYRLAY